MSRVDNWLLILPEFDDFPDGLVGDINVDIARADPAGEQQFWLLDGWGGTELPEREVYGMATNNLDPNLVLPIIREAKWDYPSFGRLMLSRQDDDDWFIRRLSEIPESI